MDEATANECIPVKGIFVGNASRNDEPQTHTFFEKNAENYATLKDIVILRAMDLFCLTVLRDLQSLDPGDQFWKEFFGCKGSFDGTKFWNALPEELRLPRMLKARPALRRSGNRRRWQAARG